MRTLIDLDREAGVLSMIKYSKSSSKPDSDNYASAYSYSILRSLSNLDYSIPFRPFGKESTQEGAHKYTEVISSASSISTVWVIADVDGDISTDPVGTFGSKYPSMAKKPVHGNGRNFLFSTCTSAASALHPSARIIIEIWQGGMAEGEFPFLRLLRGR